MEKVSVWRDKVLTMSAYTQKTLKFKTNGFVQQRLESTEKTIVKLIEVTKDPIQTRSSKSGHFWLLRPTSDIQSHKFLS